MDLNKHIVKNDDSNPLHSHGYAVVANGNRIGSTSGESFNQRQMVERDRRLVDNYRLSAIGRTRGALKFRHTNNINDQDRTTIRQKFDNQKPISVSSKRFNEPAPRLTNPYA